MKTDPLNDTWLFLQGLQPDQEVLGSWRLFFTGLFAALLLLSIVIAIAAWRRDPAQRGAGPLWTWLFRALIGAMWFEGSLWKLPLPVAGGLQYWSQLMVENAAYPAFSRLVETVFLPNMTVFDPLVFAAELGMAVSFILGLFVRPVAVLGMIYTAGLWIGLYRSETEWPWEYVFLIIAMGQFAVANAGTCLGLDGVLRRPRRRRA